MCYASLFEIIVHLFIFPGDNWVKEVCTMNDKFLESVKELNYAELNKNQEDRLKDMEKQFNKEFDTNYYLMAMKRDYEY